MVCYKTAPVVAGVCMLWSAACLLWALPGLAQTDGYRLLPRGAGVGVDRAQQWEQWTLPTHATDIDPVAHTVTPRSIGKDIDVIRNLAQFRVKIGDEKAYDKLLKELKREKSAEPLNIVTGPASVVGVPIVHLKDNNNKGISVGDPVLWYFYQGGIREAPNNPSSAPNILDGDPTTYWEPTTEVSAEEYEALLPSEQGPVYYFAQDDSEQESRVDREVYDQAPRNRRRVQYNSRLLEGWYVDVELARVVPVSRIVLRFVDGDVGEPFRQFRILTTPSHVRSDPLSLTARTVTPNEDERVVVFDDLNPDDPDRDHLLVHRLRIQVTDSKFDKVKQVSEEEFLALPLENQGGIDYYIVNAVGDETKVEKEIFDLVAPERRSRLVYFQRERPRLAEVEVWSQGDNIALGILDGGGSVDLFGPLEATVGFDGLYGTKFRQSIWLADPTYENRGILIVDLGALFWIDQLRWVGDISSLDDYTTRLSDGSRDSNGNLKWTEVDRSEEGVVRKNYEQTLEPPMQVRYLWSRAVRPTYERIYSIPANTFREVQLFGDGYVPEVVLTSPMIELPGSFLLGSIEWEADVPDPDLVEVEIRTRTGDRLREVTEHYGNSGEIKTPQDYDKLPTSLKGPVVTRRVPGGGWSPWSQKYLESGDRVTSPAPRQFLQIQAKLISRTPDLAGSLRSVRVHFLPPVGRRMMAEIWPSEVPVGELRNFEFYLNPTFVERQVDGEEGPRFDEILLDASPIQQIDLLDVSLGPEEDLQEGAGQHFTEVGSHQVDGEDSYWFEAPSGDRFMALIDPTSGDTLKVVEGGIAATDPAAPGSRLLLRLPHKVGLLTQTDNSRIYNRLIREEGEEVPVDEDGRLLNELTYLNLPSEQEGRIVYFAITGTNQDGEPVLEEVSDFQYGSLEDSLKGDVQYFRRLIGKGGEFPFDREGNPLDRTAYNRLPRTEKGSIVANGELVRVRFKASVILNGTTIDAAVRDSNSPDSWQQVDAGDATSLRESTALSISVPVTSQVLQNVEIEPNPFTPNADGINDQSQIRFAIGNLNADRDIRVQIFDLSGRAVWRQTQIGFGEQHFIWNGRDNRGQTVPPGLYVCKIEVDTDADKSSGTVDRIIAVVY